MKRHHIIILILLTVSLSFLNSNQTAHANEGVSVEKFLREFLERSGLEVVADVLDLEQIIIKYENLGILMEDDFEDYTHNITRQECALILGRYLIYSGETIDNNLRSTLISNKRLSDYEYINKKYREYAMDAFTAGIMPGDSNGYGMKSRKFAPEKEMSASEISSVILALIDLDKRRTFSNDGQLIRTTDLPVNHEDFPYILETYPNSFYEMKYEFMMYHGFSEKWVKDYFTVNYLKKNYSYSKYIDINGRMWYQTDKEIEKPYNTFCTPAMIKNNAYDFYCYSDFESDFEITSYFTDFNSIYSYFEEDWCKVINDYLSLKYNVDYSTIDSKWAEKMNKVSCSPDSQAADYIKRVKKNKTKIESKVISVEPSTFYYHCSSKFIRAYVKFRVTSGISLFENTLFYEDVPLAKSMYRTGEKLKKNHWYTIPIDVPISSTGAVISDKPRYDITFLTQYVNFPYYSITMKHSMNMMEAPISKYTQVEKDYEYGRGYFWELKK
jgi:hypothetical protein